MANKINQALTSGIVGTIAMTLITFIASMMGMPKMSPPAMLAGMMDFPLAVGWMMHFMIGIIFAFLYVYLISNWLKKMNSPVLKGIIFGAIVFIIGQIAAKIMTAIAGGMSTPSDGIFMVLMGSLIGHVIYGIAVSLTVKRMTSLLQSKVSL